MVKQMSIEIIYEQYESLSEFMIKGYVFLELDKDVFLKNHIEELKKNKYNGICTFNIIKNTFQRKTYDFACIEPDYTEDFLLMKPIKIPDLDFNDYFGLVGEEPVDQEYHNYWTFTSYQPSAYKTDKNEFVNFEGNVVEKSKNDSFVTENSINYQTTETEFQTPCVDINSLKEWDLLSKMEEDNFMGKIKRYIVYNTGEKAVEEYYIDSVEDDEIFMSTNSIRNTSNIPTQIRLYDVPYDNPIMNVYTEYKLEYIPYSNLEQI